MLLRILRGKLYDQIGGLGGLLLELRGDDLEVKAAR